MTSRAFTGAWIETSILLVQFLEVLGRAFTGAWIETDAAADTDTSVMSRLHGRVD